jgi:hypothetical protein
MAKKKEKLAELGQISDLAPSLIDWSSGPGAQMEFVGPSPYKRNYALPWRSALRRPIEPFALGGPPYDVLREGLRDLKSLLNKGDRKHRESRSPAITESSKKQLIQELVAIRETTGTDLMAFGYALFDALFPERLLDALKQTGDGAVYIEIGVDEKLNEFPFELILVDGEYLCLKHNFGRYVVSADINEDPPRPNVSAKRQRSMLLVSVSDPKPQNCPPGISFEELSLAESEAESINLLLKPVLGDNLVYLQNPSWEEFREVVNAARKQNRSYDVIHFCGHGYFDEQNPANSALVFQNRLMTGNGGLTPLCKGVRPVFCFINACQSVGASDASERFNLYGLGKTFLETGAYLLGSRSLIHDDAAMIFAKEFYTHLLIKNRALGEAVRLARLACKEAVENSFDWASYVFYGDPRVNFPRALSS